MSFAETQRLLTVLDMQDNMSGKLRGAVGAVRQTENAMGRVGRGLSNSLNTFSGRLKGLVSGPLGLVGLAGGIYGIERGIHDSVDAATEFHKQMELVATQAGATQAEVVAMTPAIEAMARSVGTGPEALAEALYHAESAGFRSAKALEIVRIAAEGAKTGNADLEQTVNALIGAEQSGIKGAEDYTKAMGTLNAIVGAGNLRMEDLVASFGSGVLASARTFGISMQSVGAALATMTDEGIPAIDAATRLRMSFSLLGAPSGKAIGILKDIGIGQYQLARDMRTPGGILTAIQDLRKHMIKAKLIGPDGNPTAEGAAMISRAFGGGRSSAAIMTLLSNVSLFQTKQEQVNKTADKFGESWARTQETAAFKFAQFGAVWDRLQITIGDKILPMITEGLGGLTDWIDTHTDDIAGFVGGIAAVVKTAVGAIGTVLGGISKFWDAIPKPMRDLLIGGFAADRTIKFLFGFSPAHMVVEGIETALGKVVGQTVANKLIPQNVFVVNWAMIAGAGAVGGAIEGAGAAAAGAAGAGGLGAAVGAGALGALAFIAATGASLVAALAAVQKLVIEPGLQQQAGKNITEVQDVIASGDRQKMVDALNGIKASTENLDPIQKVLYELNADGVKAHVEGLEQALTDAIAKTPSPGSPDDRDAANKAQADAKAQLDKINKARDAIETMRIANASMQRTIASDVRTGADRIVDAIDRKQLVVNVYTEKGDAGSRPSSQPTGTTVSGGGQTPLPTGPGHSNT